jgi:tripartite-type tricarboxylate transporter receptor subunit TctC
MIDQQRAVEVFKYLPLSRRQFLITPFAAVLGLNAQLAVAQSTLQLASITVGFPAGGSSDLLARILAEKLRGKFAETILVDNRPGAGGRMAVEYVKEGSGDGRRLLLSPGGMMVLFPHIYKNLRYQPMQDFAPVTMVVKYPFVLAISSLVPTQIHTLDEFLQWCKTNPGSASFGSPGEGTRAHFAGIMLGRSADISYTHVPYKGMAPLVKDLLGGQIASGILTPADAAPLVASRKVRLVATTGTLRSSFMPEVPTFLEAGHKDIEIEEMYALFVPASTPQQTVNRLATLVQQALALDDVQAKLSQLALEPVGNSPAQFKAFMKAEYDRWGLIAKTSGFVPSD